MNAEIKLTVTSYRLALLFRSCHGLTVAPGRDSKSFPGQVLSGWEKKRV